MRSHASVVTLAVALAACGGRDAVPPGPTAARPAPSHRATRLPPELADAAGPSGTSDAADRYDVVGYASWYGAEAQGGATASGAPFDPSAITAAHRTLPLGSQAEVTALDTGRTIIVLVNDRGPVRPDREIDLSRGAAALLGAGAVPVSAVRVRAIVASASDVAALRAGRAPAPRLDTPPAVLAALRRQLPATTSVRPASISVESKRQATRVVRPSVARTGDSARFIVQVAAFSSQSRADALAARMRGRVVPGGRLWRVRLGPFDDRAAANRARDVAAAQGYGDAHIQIAIPD